MNGVINETEIWHCDICKKTINFTSRLRHIISKSLIHKKEYGIVVSLLKKKLLGQKLMK